MMEWITVPTYVWKNTLKHSAFSLHINSVRVDVVSHFADEEVEDDDEKEC